MSAILDKLKKLLSQQEGEERLGNQAAAEAFASKVQELLIKHKLELADVMGHATPTDDPLITLHIEPEEWGGEYVRKRDSPAEGLLSVICENFFCRGLTLLESNVLMVVGRRSDADIAKEVYCRIRKVSVSICEASIAEMILKQTDNFDARLWELTGGNERFRWSFYAGFTYSLKQRLERERDALKLNAGETAALVRMTKDVDDFVKDEHNPADAPTEEPEHEIRRDAFIKGSIHGNSVSIKKESKQIT